MSFFTELLNELNLERHDGRALWKYNLSEVQINRLSNELKFDQPSVVDPRDVILYYAHWWKSQYDGGAPSKKEVFESLRGKSRYNLDEENFYKIARKGAQVLGVKWIKKQNILYFRTLLLQGGLPIKHMAANHGAYLNFLFSVLEVQPETIDDFMFQPQIINLLPKSSQNDIIYESCFEIVKSILNEDETYDDLFKSDDVLSEITRKLKIRKQSLIPRVRHSKPKNYWLLTINEDTPVIILRIGFADSYNPDSLSNILGFEAAGQEYQFFVNDKLICVFLKMLNGNFKTDWFSTQDERWDGDSNLPYAYVIENGEKKDVKDFIQTIPNFYEPGLWAKHTETEWRLVKGSGTSEKEAAILFPATWKTDLQSVEIRIHEFDLLWAVFEGEARVTFEEEHRVYRSTVKSFDWTIVSQKPYWMLKSSMPVVQKMPQIMVYDENNNALSKDRYKVWIKRRQQDENWQSYSVVDKLPLGCIDIKLERDGLVAHDTFFNLGNIRVDYIQKSIDKAEIEIKNKHSLEFKLDESSILEIESDADSYSLKVKTEFSKIPTGIKGSVGFQSKKKLHFDLVSPFEGMAIVDKDGSLVGTDEQLSLSNLYGHRILSTPNKESLIRLRNKIKTDVTIINEISEPSFPLISLKDEILRLYYLGDVMDYRNKVSIELVEGRDSKFFDVSLFTHTLNVDDQYSNSFKFYYSDANLDLFAIHLNCKAEEIDLIPLHKEDGHFEIPNTEITSQFIVISPPQEGNQLMPRFVNKDESYNGIDKIERIEGYHSQLAEESFEHQIWKQLLSYFNICVENEIPFSSIDQIIAISKSSQVAAKAFFYLGVNQVDSAEFIQKYIPEMERHLGFCFHWIKKEDWGIAINEVCKVYGDQFFSDISQLSLLYFWENNLSELLQFMHGKTAGSDRIYNSDIRELRKVLGETVLSELPYSSPRITNNYCIHIDDNKQVRLLIQAPIAVAESILDVQQEYPIWGGDEFRDNIRRNIQYSQYLNPNFYKKVLLHVLKNN